MSPRPTPPERVPVEDALARWKDIPRSLAADALTGTPLAGYPGLSVIHAGDALAAALEAIAAERYRLVWDLALANAAADRTDEIARQAIAERDRAHATLREIAERELPAVPSWHEREMARLARERLENP